MEAIAVASSLAGIISLAGQCVNGAEHLKGLFDHIAGASKTVDYFLRDINSLIRTLHDVRILLETAADVSGTGEGDASVASLQIQLEDCQTDITGWLKIAKELRPTSGRGARSWARKFWVAANQNSVSGIRQEINCRRVEVGTSLLLVSNIRDLRTKQDLDRVETKVDVGNAVSVELREILQRLESLGEMNSSVGSLLGGSMKSLQSMSSSMSKVSNHTDVGRFVEENVSVAYRSVSRRTSLQTRPTSSRSSTAPSGRDLKSSSSWTSPSIHNISAGPRSTLCNEYRTEASIMLERKLGATPADAVVRSTRIGTPFTCAFCTVQFSTAKEAELHQQSHEQRQYSWSCSALPSVDAAYYVVDQESLRCGYCGTQVTWKTHPQAKYLCRKHLLSNHFFNRCPAEKRFFGVEDFRQHLKHAHNAIAGNWTTLLEKVCMEGVPSSREADRSSLEPALETAADQLETLWSRLQRRTVDLQPGRTNPLLSTSFALDSILCPDMAGVATKLRLAGMYKQEEDLINMILSNWSYDENGYLESLKQSDLVRQRDHLKQMKEGIISAVRSDLDSSTNAPSNPTKKLCGMWEDLLRRDHLGKEQDEATAASDIRTHSYDASLLGTWNGSRDRVNRWMLHSLGSSEDQAKIHRSMLPDADIPVQAWSRLTLKTWFLDEAALGGEIEPPTSVDAADSIDASSLFSSKFESCRSRESVDGYLEHKSG
ncbi:MAG: hypothetical protein M1820_002988 [Bogoriella megaspora]|nr:MAG: hypothetical protein M1820_002988 [Bogoriella megaspora]